MVVLWIIVLATLALAVRAGIHGRRWTTVDSETHDDGSGEDWIIDTCARTFILVLLSLLGLLALGLLYGNVLGAVPAAS